MPTMTSATVRLRRSSLIFAQSLAVLREEQPQGDVQQQADAAEEGEDHERHPQDHGVDVEMTTEPPGDARDLPVGAAAPDPGEVADVVPSHARTGVRCRALRLGGVGWCRGHVIQGAPTARRTPSGEPLIAPVPPGPGLRVRPGIVLVVRDPADLRRWMDHDHHRAHPRRGLPRRPRSARPRATPATRSSAESRRGWRATSACRCCGCAPAFLVTAVLGGSGILFYAGLWLRAARQTRTTTAALPASRAPRGRDVVPVGSGASPTPARRSRWSRSASAWCSRPRPSSATAS